MPLSVSDVFPHSLKKKMTTLLKNNHCLIELMKTFHNKTCARVSSLFRLVLHRKGRVTLQSALEKLPYNNRDGRGEQE